jgi:hypothetical protein
MMKTKLQKEGIMGNGVNEYRQDMIQRMVSTLVASGVPQERAQLIAARHAAGESTRVFRPGSNLPVSLPIWKFLPTATWCDVPLAGIYTEYGPDGKIIREVSVDSARAQAAAVLGSISTPKKTAAARKNARLGGRPMSTTSALEKLQNGAEPESLRFTCEADDGQGNSYWVRRQGATIIRLNRFQDNETGAIEWSDDVSGWEK